MSPSDTTLASSFLQLVNEASELEREVHKVAWPDAMDLDACGRLLGIAIRFYSVAVEVKAESDPLPALGLTPTDAVVVATAALRDQDLSPFDLTLWFQRALQESKKSNSINAGAERPRPHARSN